jgi:DNA polymerase III delta subunit
MRSSAGRSKAGKGDDPERRPKKAGAGKGRASAGARGSARPTPASARGSAPATGRGRNTGRTSPVTLLESLERGEFPPSIYLEGPCEPVKAALLAELRAAWAVAVPVAPLATVLRAAESAVEHLTAAWQGASLFSPRDLVIVLDIEDWGRSEKKVTALAEVLAKASTPSTMVLVESASDTPRKSLEALRRACRMRIEAPPPSLAELVLWGERRFRREAFEVEAGVLPLLAETCEGDPLAFFSELDKLCVWAARDRRLGLEEAGALLRPVVGSELPDYLAAVAAGDSARASQRLGRLLAAGVSEGSLLFALSNLVGGALGGWARDPGASAALQRRLHPVQLSRALDAVYRAEAAWKGGRDDAVAVLEQATREVCGM